MELLKEGVKAPSFVLKCKDGKDHLLEDFDNDYIILYFYPKDNTPGCKVEAQGFTNDKAKYKKLNAEVIGISGGDEKTKTNFYEKCHLRILLLSDTEFKVSTKYGVYGEKKFMGRTYMGISRVTYILDKNKKIIKVFDKVKPPIHSKEVLEFLKSQK